MFLSERFVRSASVALVSFIVEYFSIPSTLQNFLKSPANSVPCSTQIFFGLFFLVIFFENVLTVSFESFVFIPFASTVLSNKCWRTSEYFTPILSFANLSTCARSMNQILSLTLAKALILLKLHVACLNLVNEVFQCKNSLTFEGDFHCFCQIAHRTLGCKSLRVKSLQLLSFRV